MTPNAIASSFVECSRFEGLSMPENTVLVGPRGSGKTTLLKMLQLDALRSWSSSEAEKFRRKINFIGVFVPADVAWGKQLEALGQGALSEKTRNRLAISSYTTHVFKAINDSFQKRINVDDSLIAPHYMMVESNPLTESELVDDLSHIWKIKPRISSFYGLGQALRERQMAISILAAQLAEKSLEISDVIDRPENEYLGVNAIEGFVSATAAFNEKYNDRDRAWALAVDELEIAPIEIQTMLFSGFRSLSQHTYLKLATSPHSGALFSKSDLTSPSQRQDYRRIPLWYGKQKEAIEFGARLFVSLINRNLDTRVKAPVEVLGESRNLIGIGSDFEFDTEWQRGVDTKKSILSKEFKELIENDTSFEKFIRERSIDVNNLDTSDSNPTGPTIRKIAPLVTYRNYFFKGNEGNQESRARKYAKYYAGNPAIFVVAEGNPRWIVGMALDLIRESNTKTSFSEPSQTKVIENASRRFVDMAQSAPIATDHPLLIKKGILGLVESLALWIENELIGGFKEEPLLSFEVDTGVPDGIMAALIEAINLGIIIVQDSDEDFSRNLIGRRVRLSYMLAPTYKLPLRTNKPVKLSTALSAINSTSKSSTNRRNAPPEQGSLF